MSDLPNSRQPDKPFERIAFGQARIEPTFSNGVTLTGQVLSILAGAQPPLTVTRFNGQLAAVNNRTLAAFGIAGVRPTNLINREFSTLPPSVQGRFGEAGVPNFRISVTFGRTPQPPRFFVDAPRR